MEHVVNRSQAALAKHMAPVLSMGKMVGQNVAKVFVNRSQAAVVEHVSPVLSMGQMIRTATRLPKNLES